MTTPTTHRRQSVTEPTGAALRFPAVIFDMDGVVTDTARLHAAAWTAAWWRFGWWWQAATPAVAS